MSLKLKLRNIPQCYSCPQCQQIFKNALHLKYHKFRVHNSRRPYICRSCCRTFHSVCELQDHSRVHNDSPTMQCHVCDDCFPTRKLLKQHMGVHVQYEGDHECGYCLASFLSLSDARLHVLLVHDDTSVLPPCKVRKKCAVSEREVFTVKEGDGLKLKLKRKLSLDGDDYNMEKAGSHTSDSGRGNSDIDDDDYNKLLKTPTFIPKQETQQQFNQTESNLLLKPKLEIGASTSWTSSKYQPRLGSSDFLQKTNYLSKPQTVGFGQQSVLGSFAPKTSPAAMFGQPSLSKPFTSQSFGMGSNPLNGGVFKTPLFNSMKKPSAFGSTFGATLFTKPVINSAFGSSTSFGIKPPNGFLQPQPIKQTTATNVQSNVSSPASTDSGSITVKKEAIFGSKEHTRSIMLTEEEQPNAFEKYAGDEQDDRNPFAEAMKQAKNPPPRFDSELSETSYESESSSESEDAVIDTDDLVAPEVSMTPRIEEIVPDPEPVKPKLTPVHELSLFDLPPPTPYLSPVRETVHDHMEPIHLPEPEPLPPSPVPVSPEMIPPRQSPRKTRRRKSPKQPSITLSPLVNGNLYDLPKYEENESEKTNGVPSPLLPRTTRRETRRSLSKPFPESKSKPTEFTEPPTPLMNGDVGHAPSEISGHIDLEVPSFMINIPRSLVNEPSAKSRSRNNSGVKPRGGRTPGSRTPARTAARTPARTPSRTPLYNTNFDIVPPTPIMPDIPEKPIRTPTRAPSKEEMMKKHEQQAKKIVKRKSPKKRPKPRIGPKSYMKSINEYREETEEEEDTPVEIEPEILEDGSFSPDEVYQETSAGRTDVHSHGFSSFKQNAKFLLYLRQRALDMLIILFPHLRVGGHFSASTDVDGLIDYLISTLNGDDGMRRVMHSQSSKREQCKIVVNRSTKYEIKQLCSRIIKLLKLCFPFLTLDTVTKQGIDAIPKLIQKIITENS